MWLDLEHGGNDVVALMQPADTAAFERALAKGNAQDPSSRLLHEQVDGWEVMSDRQAPIDAFKRANAAGVPVLADDASFKQALGEYSADAIVKAYLSGARIADELRANVPSGQQKAVEPARQARLARDLGADELGRRPARRDRARPRRQASPLAERRRQRLRAVAAEGPARRRARVPRLPRHRGRARRPREQRGARLAGAEARADDHRPRRAAARRRERAVPPGRQGPDSRGDARERAPDGHRRSGDARPDLHRREARRPRLVDAGRGRRGAAARARSRREARVRERRAAS